MCTYAASPPLTNLTADGIGTESLMVYAVNGNGFSNIIVGNQKFLKVLSISVGGSENRVTACKTTTKYNR